MVLVFRVVVLRQVAPERERDAERVGAGGGEDEAGDVEVSREVVGPGEEEVGDDGGWWR